LNGRDQEAALRQEKMIILYTLQYLEEEIAARGAKSADQRDFNKLFACGEKTADLRRAQAFRA